jgi:uncharacterized protein (DUF302 family)
MMAAFVRVIIVIGVVVILAACDKFENGQIRSDYPEVMLTLQMNIQDKGYTISRIQRVDVGMKAAGYKLDEYRIVFFAKPADVKIVLEEYPVFASFLPLSITIYKDDDMTRLVGMPFALAKAHASEQVLKKMIVRWEKDTADIIHKTVEVKD